MFLKELNKSRIQKINIDALVFIEFIIDPTHAPFTLKITTFILPGKQGKKQGHPGTYKKVK